jgi:NADH dehydrogenase
VAAIGRWRLHGFPAWLVWMFVHILYLVEFDNQVLVLFQWAWSYLTKNRGARLITPDRLPELPAAPPAAEPLPQALADSR